MNVLKLLGANVSIIGTSPSVSYVTVVSSTTDASTYTFNSTNIGIADATRLVVVCIATNSGSVRTINRVTINGATATLIQKSDGGSLNSKAGMYALAVPTGTTADIVVNMSNTEGRCIVHVYALYNLTSTTPVTSNVSQNAASTSRTLTVAGNAGDVVLGFSIFDGGTRTSTWSNTAGVVGNNEFITSEGFVDTSVASCVAASSSGGVTITWSGTASAICLIAARWR